MSKIYRLHYRAQLKEAYSEEALEEAVKACTGKIRRLQKEGKLLTAALYCYEKMLFLYYEAIGEPLAITEPCKAKKLQEL